MLDENIETPKEINTKRTRKINIEDPFDKDIEEYKKVLLYIEKEIKKLKF